MLYGYSGKILLVDLITHGITIEQPSEDFYRTYLGGSAMGMYYLLKNTPPGVDPLSPQNTLTIMLSAPTGVAVSGQSRASVNAKSPLTDLIGDSQSGGFWPAELKFAGFDGIVITGKSTNPVYLWIHDSDVELKDASHLWGKYTGDAEKMVKEELGDEKIEVIQIGPAGERMARLSSIINMSNRAFGRTGMGAVMGSKNLKMIAVRGHGKVQVADKEAVARIALLAPKLLNESSGLQDLQDFGTASVVNPQNCSGGLPTYNYSSGFFDHAESISGEHMAETILKENDTCFGCIVRCKRVVETVFDNNSIEPSYGGPEYETIASMGSYCGIDDISAISYANQLCNMYGLDTISCGATIAFAMECFERGLLSLKDTDNIELRFGNANAMIKMVEKIGRQEGIGELLSNGSTFAAKKIGKNSLEFVVASKNQEFPAHMPQVKRCLALIYAVNPFGADHQSSDHDPAYSPNASEQSLDRMSMLGLHNPQPEQTLNREKVNMALRTQWTYSFLDSANLCQFVFGPSWHLMGPREMVELIIAVTGWDFTVDEMQRIGERRVNMMRVFNIREGAGRDRDTLPKRLFDNPLVGGPSDGLFVTRQELETALDDYYDLCEWYKENGHPKESKLNELGLGWTIQ